MYVMVGSSEKETFRAAKLRFTVRQARADRYQTDGAVANELSLLFLDNKRREQRVLLCSLVE